MEKQEPQVIVNNMSDEDLFKWMNGKVAAASNLACALHRKKSLLQGLEDVEKEIIELTKAASLNIFEPREDAAGVLTTTREWKEMNGPQLAAANFFKSKIKPTILLPCVKHASEKEHALLLLDAGFISMDEFTSKYGDI